MTPIIKRSRQLRGAPEIVIDGLPGIGGRSGELSPQSNER